MPVQAATAMLDYDDSAFYYFAITILLCYALPSTYWTLKEVWLALFGGSSSSTRTQQELEQMKELDASDGGLARLKKRGFLNNLALLVCAWALFFYLYTLVREDGMVQTFDPFQILGVEHGAEDKVIKKAYRKLSLQYHPDKNIGSKVAEEMFMKIAKAYEALTDETSKENFEKYGNPDGKQAMEISIGLPRWILDNPKVVLVMYLVGMVIVIPLMVGLWYNNSKKFGDRDIEYETYKAFYVLMKATSKLRHMPEIICCSSEFRKINEFRPEDKVNISELMGRMQNSKLMERPLYDKQPNILKGNLLLHAHLYRMTDQLTPALKKDLRKMLMRAPEYVDTMVEIARQRGWLETTLQCIRFAQCVKQGLFRNADPLKQLPHLTDEAIKDIAKDSEAAGNTLRDFLRTSDDKKKGLDKLTAEQRADVLATCKILPARESSIELYVEESEESDDEDDEKKGTAAAKVVKDDEVSGSDIFEGDLVTLRLSVVRSNAIAPVKGAKSPSALAPRFPSSVNETLFVILTNKVAKGHEDEAVVHAMEKVGDRHKMINGKAKPTQHTIQHELRFMAPPRAGEYMMQLYVLSDTYVGLDEVLDVSFSVKPASELPVYEPHPEDAELDNEPTLFEQVMAANVDEADSSDDEDEAPRSSTQEGGADDGSGSEEESDDSD